MEFGNREVLESEETKMVEGIVLKFSVELTEEVCLNCGV